MPLETGGEPRTPSRARSGKSCADRVPLPLGLTFPAMHPGLRPTLKGRQSPRGTECRKATVSPPPALDSSSVGGWGSRAARTEQEARARPPSNRRPQRVLCGRGAQRPRSGFLGAVRGRGGACVAAWARVAREGGSEGGEGGAAPPAPRWALSANERRPHAAAAARGEAAADKCY